MFNVYMETLYHGHDETLFSVCREEGVQCEQTTWTNWGGGGKNHDAY